LLLGEVEFEIWNAGKQIYIFLSLAIVQASLFILLQVNTIMDISSSVHVLLVEKLLSIFEQVLQSFDFGGTFYQLVPHRLNFSHDISSFTGVLK
jgi:hypothetical protein